MAAVAPTTRPITPAPRASAPMGRGRGMRGNREAMTSIHALLDVHDKIDRTVEDIPGGVLTVTTSDDPNVTALLRTHVAQMKQQVHEGRPIRMWDPLFAELARHHDKIKLEIEEIPGGVRVRHTSDDEQVVKLIRQHAKKGVSEFVERGWDRAHQPTPLPPE